MNKLLISILLFSTISFATPMQFFHSLLSNSGCQKQTCLSIPNFKGNNYTTCSLSTKSYDNFSYLNNFFPWISLSLATINVSNISCSSISDYNSTFSNFNSKTNNTNPINTSMTGFSDTVLTTNFNNLLLNIKQKVESLNTYLDPYSAPFLTDYISGNTYYIKIENSSYVKTKVLTLYNGTTCVNDTYCKVSLSSNPSGTFNIAQVQFTDASNNTVTKTIIIRKEYLEEYAPYDTQDKGCHNADVVSGSTYDHWACDGTSSSNPCYYAVCYHGNCATSYSTNDGDGNLIPYNNYYLTTNPPPVVYLFNTYYNTNGLYTYIGYERTTGDIRNGCGGTYVYGIRVKYSTNRYRLNSI